jgi:hypothetical protein
MPSLEDFGPTPNIGSQPGQDLWAWLSLESQLSFLLLPLPQPHAGATAVLMDEFDTAVFKRGSNLPDRFFSSAQFTIHRLQSSDRRFRDARPSR